MLWIGAVIGVASAVMSGVSAIQGNQKAKAASNAASSYANQLKNLKEQNPYAAVQATDIMSLAADRNAQAQSQSVDALQGMGSEGAGQVTALNNAVQKSNLQAAQDQAMLNFQRDSAEAEAGLKISEREVNRQGNLLASQLEGAQLAAAAGETQKNEGIQGVFSGAAGAINSTSGIDTFDHKKTKTPNQADVNTANTNYNNLYQSSGGDLNWLLQGNIQ